MGHNSYIDGHDERLHAAWLGKLLLDLSTTLLSVVRKALMKR